jgi:hypothetical protein
MSGIAQTLKALSEQSSREPDEPVGFLDLSKSSFVYSGVCMPNQESMGQNCPSARRLDTKKSGGVELFGPLSPAGNGARALYSSG